MYSDGARWASTGEARILPFQQILEDGPPPSAQHGRVIGGRFRGRVIRFPRAEGLRPTPDRVRETLFNWLGQDLTGWRCLDAFAGSGALGFEAASRGADAVGLL